MHDFRIDLFLLTLRFEEQKNKFNIISVVYLNIKYFSVFLSNDLGVFREPAYLLV